jgi:thiol-disulfide isomerase/thioredoxin
MIEKEKAGKHRKTWRWNRYLACLALLVGLSASAAYETEEPVDFSLPQLGGGQVSLSDFRGEWVLINYWATWCSPCRKEMPELSALHDERDDVTVLGLAFEDTDDSAFEEFLAEFHASYPILRVDVYHPPEPFGAPKVLPTTIILDAEGRAVKAFLGPVTREDIERFIDSTPAHGAEPAQ